MIVYPKRETTNEGTFLTLYNKDSEIIARSTAAAEDKIIAIEYDGLIYTSFPQLPDHYFLDYASVVKKFKS